MLSYIYNYFFPKEEEEKKDDSDFIIVKEYLHITANDLKSVNLLPSKERVINTQIKNKNHKNVNMQDLNKEQLKQIMNVKLKPVKVEKKKHIYKQRHPVLKELQEKITKK
jgi:hypothetical protein